MPLPTGLAVVPSLDVGGGGVFQYSLTVLDALAREPQDDVLVVLTRTEHLAELDGAERRRVAVLPAPAAPPTARRLLWRTPARVRHALRPLRRTLAPRRLLDPDSVRRRPDLTDWFRAHGVRLALYPEARTLAFEVDVPFVAAVHDLQHRLQPHFPEVSADGEWERREHLFRNTARHATAVVVDSEVGREDALDAYASYGLTPERVEVLPFVAPAYVAPPAEEDVARVRARHGLPERYLFYPAQFWPHKNHVRLVEALGELKRRGIEPHLVLSGSHAGELRQRTHRELRRRADELGVAGQIRSLGFVAAEDVAPLYAGAVALVFPTFFGPTNIPLIEAWTVGCPVLTSDIRGVREQVGDAGLLADPTSPEEIAAGIERLWTDDALRAELARKGEARVRSYTSDDFRRRLLAILRRAAERSEERRAQPVRGSGRG